MSTQKAGAIAEIDQREPCGCDIYRPGTDYGRIVYCSLHAAAPALRDALRALLLLLHGEETVTTLVMREQYITRARAALRVAEEG